VLDLPGRTRAAGTRHPADYGATVIRVESAKNRCDAHGPFKDGTQASSGPVFIHQRLKWRPLNLAI
jgi:hypothetical protein